MRSFFILICITKTQSVCLLMIKTLLLKYLCTLLVFLQKYLKYKNLQSNFIKRINKFTNKVGNPSKIM